MSGPVQLVNLVLSLLAFSLVAKWYVLPRLRAAPLRAALEPFLLLHSFRHIGLMFLAGGAVKTTLPVAFAQPAAFGDLAASILAFVSLLALRRGWAGSLGLVWAFNLVGTLDLFNAVGRGVMYDAAAGMGGTFWIPSVVVPALLVTHALMFILLVREQRTAASPGAARSGAARSRGGTELVAPRMHAPLGGIFK